MRRSFAIAVAASLLLHVLPLVTFLLWHEPARMVTPPATDPNPADQGTVELVMVEQQGAGEPQAAPQVRQPEQPQEQPPERQPEQPRHVPREVEAPEPPAMPPPTPTIADSLPLPPPPPPAPPPPELPPDLSEIAEPPPPPPAPERPDAAPQDRAEDEPQPAPDRPAQVPPETVAAQSTPTPPRQATAPEFNLGGTDSPSNAIVLGDSVIPASPDDQSRNRPPVYPIEASRRGQQGTVTLLIHVSPLGVAVGADVLQSSGHTLLDRAAQDAVMTWRFRPAVRNGAPVPFDMAMRFIFALE